MKSLLKGIFQSRATLSRHCKTWDVNLVLHLVHWLTMGNSQELSLKDLTLKLVMFSCINHSAERTVSAIIAHSENDTKMPTDYTIMLNSNTKQSKPGQSTSELVIKLNAFPHDHNLCAVNTCSVKLRKVPKFVFKANLQNRLLEVLMEEDDYVGIPFLIKKFQKKISK